MDQEPDNDITALTRQTYDRIAGEFAERVWSITEVGERIVRFADYLLSLGNDASELRVLDAGCGPGRDSLHLQKLGFQVTGVDVSEGMIAEARRRVSPPAEFQVMDLRDLRFPEAHFDGIWCNASLLHVPRAAVPGVLAQMRRVLRAEGMLYLAVKEGEGEAVRGRDEGKPRFFTYFAKKELRTLVTDAGFRIIDSGHGHGMSAEGLPWLHLFAAAPE